MADKAGQSLLSEESDSLSPLPSAHRQGLVAIAALAGLSLVSSTLTLSYLTIKLVRWHFRTRKTLTSAADDFLEVPFAGEELRAREPAKPPAKAHPNQFLVLIFNLLLADIHQAAAFLINAVWAGQNSIDVQSRACFAQGWLVSTGDLASSFFITAIAVHTYLAVVRSYKPPQWVVYLSVVGLWLLNYLLAVIGPAITRNGRDHGGFYVRAAAWCWVNVSYETYRLVLHYLFIFISLAVTSILYTLIFFTLRARSGGGSRVSSSPRNNAVPDTDSSHFSSHFSSRKHTNLHMTTTTTTTNDQQEIPSAASISGHHNAFLLYPVIYVVCTAPLALGRIVSMAAIPVPISYFCAAGALIASNGWLDVLLWGLTRRRLLFCADVDTEESGLDTFTFMRTPPNRRYGNIVWVEGASAGAARPCEANRRVTGDSSTSADESGGGGGWISRGESDTTTERQENNNNKRRWRWHPGGRGGDENGREQHEHTTGRRHMERRRQPKPKTASQESLRGMTMMTGHRQQSEGGGNTGVIGIGIQMDIMTSIIVERERERERDGMRR